MDLGLIAFLARHHAKRRLRKRSFWMIAILPAVFTLLPWMPLPVPTVSVKQEKMQIGARPPADRHPPRLLLVHDGTQQEQIASLTIMLAEKDSPEQLFIQERVVAPVDVEQTINDLSIDVNEMRLNCFIVYGYRKPCEEVGEGSRMACADVYGYDLGREAEIVAVRLRKVLLVRHLTEGGDGRASVLAAATQRLVQTRSTVNEDLRRAQVQPATSPFNGKQFLVLWGLSEFALALAVAPLFRGSVRQSTTRARTEIELAAMGAGDLVLGQIAGVTLLAMFVFSGYAVSMGFVLVATGMVTWYQVAIFVLLTILNYLTQASLYVVAGLVGSSSEQSSPTEPLAYGFRALIFGASFFAVFSIGAGWPAVLLYCPVTAANLASAYTAPGGTVPYLHLGMGFLTSAGLTLTAMFTAQRVFRSVVMMRDENCGLWATLRAVLRPSEK